MVTTFPSLSRCLCAALSVYDLSQATSSLLRLFAQQMSGCLAQEDFDGQRQEEQLHITCIDKICRSCIGLLLIPCVGAAMWQPPYLHRLIVAQNLEYNKYKYTITHNIYI